MDISIGMGGLASFFSQPPDLMLLNLFLMGGWIPFALVFLWGAKELWVYYINNQFAAEQKFLLLAVDVPRGNAESLRSVENMFTYLAGGHGSLNLIDTYWFGKFQLGFSFEIVSIDGYTQFLIHTPAAFRNLVESAVYSVYPDAEISEVNDYTDNVPDRFPDSEWDMWGAEFIQVTNQAYPIKTYPEFQDQNSPNETAFKDPLASLMDLNSTLRPGEQLWYQILVKPIDFAWVKASDNEVKKLLKEKVPAKKDVLDHVLDLFVGVFGFFIDILKMAWTGEDSASSDDADDPMKMMNLKPNEKKKIEAIQYKASKVGFECKIRMIYIARKDVINKPKVVNGFVGYIKQFIDLDLNNFKPDMDKTATSVAYLFKDSRLKARQNNIMAGYKNRSGSTGRVMGVFNVEELATLWHFPFESVVKAPLIQKAPGRKSEPPMTLPFEEEFVPAAGDTGTNFKQDVLEKNFDEAPVETKEDLPFVDDSKKDGIEEFSPEKNTSTRPSFFDDDEVAEQKEDSNKKADIPGNLPFV